MPLAVQYGMPLNEFWHGDMRLLAVYQKAYMKNISYTAWWHGNYNRIAVEIGAKNALITKKSDHIDKWIDYNDPTYIHHKPKITIENLESEFRKQQAEQSDWLFNR